VFLRAVVAVMVVAVGSGVPTPRAPERAGIRTTVRPLSPRPTLVMGP
jgi:hypothetical protein